MRERGVTCNLGTYNALLDACAKASCMDRSAALLQDMSAAGLEPDIITFSTIIKGFCAQGDMQEAFSTLKDMKRQVGMLGGARDMAPQTCAPHGGGQLGRSTVAQQRISLPRYELDKACVAARKNVVPACW